jgi:hypothetical protein
MVTVKKPSSKISTEDVQSFEHQYEIELPEEYKQFLLNNNGGIPDKVYYTENDADLVINFFLSLGSEKYSIEEYIKDWRQEGLANELVPIGEDAFGNLICISCKGDNKGQVYVWNHELSEIRLIAPSFNYLLSNLKPDLE